MNKKQALIQDTVDACSKDRGYLLYIVEEHFRNLSENEIDILYEEMEVNNEAGKIFEDMFSED